MASKFFIGIVLAILVFIVATNLDEFTGSATKELSKCITDTHKQGYKPFFSVSPKEISKNGEFLTITFDSGCIKNKMYLCKVGEEEPLEIFFNLRPITSSGKRLSKYKYCDTSKFDAHLFPLTFEKVVYLYEEGEYYISIEDLTSRKYYGQLMPEAHFFVR